MKKRGSQAAIDLPVSVSPGKNWRSQPLPTAPFQFYRLAFRSRAESPGYWAVFPFDAGGKEMRADAAPADISSGRLSFK